jgi:hypothetical protein
MNIVRLTSKDRTVVVYHIKGGDLLTLTAQGENGIVFRQVLHAPVAQQDRAPVS